MSHYFDDIIHRHVDGALTPRSPMLSPTAPRLRRSSTSRSLAARSDYSISDLNGYGDDADAAVYGGGGGGGYHARRGSVNRALLDDPERVRARAEADAHLHSYITQQLERVMQERGADGYSEGEEFETLP